MRAGSLSTDLFYRTPAVCTVVTSSPFRPVLSTIRTDACPYFGRAHRHARWLGCPLRAGRSQKYGRAPFTHFVAFPGYGVRPMPPSLLSPVRGITAVIAGYDHPSFSRLG